MIDLNKLTMGEIALIEKLGGQAISMIGEDEAPKGLPMAALAMVLKRRAGFPDFTWNDAKNLPMEEVNELLGNNDDDTGADDDGEDEGEGEDPSEG